MKGKNPTQNPISHLEELEIAASISKLQEIYNNKNLDFQNFVAAILRQELALL